MPSQETPLAFDTLASLIPGTYSPWLLAASVVRTIQSRKTVTRELIPVSHVVPDIAGCSTAPASEVTLVVIWLVKRIAMFQVVASLLILVIMSPITAQRLPDAHCAASFFRTVVCWLLTFSPVLGYARANNVDKESMTMRLVSGGGECKDWCVRRASR